MTRRFFAAMCVFAGVGWLVPVDASPQSGTTPRTAWGAPDLQGVWDFRSLTPMERPEQFAENEVLTAEEAAAFSEDVIRSRSRDSETSDRATRAAQGDIIPYNDFWFDEGTLVTSDRPSLVVDPPDGWIPDITAAERQRQDELAMARKGVSSHEPTPGGFVEDLGPGGLQVRCILGFNSGPPLEPSGYNNNVQLFQTEDTVALLTEMVHDARIVPLDGRPHLPSAMRQWKGDSRGYWDGDTLVVESTNFLRETNFLQGETSEHLTLTERFTRVDADRLVYQVTVDDPTTWTRPWTYEVPMKKNPEPVYEYACHEGNYGLYNILAGAR
jgi:hypothetical protein